MSRPDGRNGLAVVEVLEAADRAMKKPQISRMARIGLPPATCKRLRDDTLVSLVFRA